MPITKIEILQQIAIVPDKWYEEIDDKLKREWRGDVTHYTPDTRPNNLQVDEIKSVYVAAGWAVEYDEDIDRGQGSRLTYSFKFS